MKHARGRISPTMAVALTGLWLLLNQSLSPGHILLGALISIALLRLSSTLRPLQARVRRVDTALWLIAIVIRDIVRSNYHVACLVLGLTGGRDIRSAFLDVPLQLRDPHGLAALACIVTATPGTVWAGLSGSGDTLTLHVLDLEDEAALIRQIKHRYEQPLMRIFE